MQFYTICKALEAEGYLTNVDEITTYIDGEHRFSLQGAEITISGIKYIKENNAIYKGLKEFSSWLPLSKRRKYNILIILFYN